MERSSGARGFDLPYLFPAWTVSAGSNDAARSLKNSSVTGPPTERVPAEELKKCACGAHFLIGGKSYIHLHIHRCWPPPSPLVGEGGTVIGKINQ
jgi:hypothetical protein